MNFHCYHYIHWNILSKKEIGNYTTILVTGNWMSCGSFIKFIHFHNRNSFLSQSKIQMKIAILFKFLFSRIFHLLTRQIYGPSNALCGNNWKKGNIYALFNYFNSKLLNIFITFQIKTSENENKGKFINGLTMTIENFIISIFHSPSLFTLQLYLIAIPMLKNNNGKWKLF